MLTGSNQLKFRGSFPPLIIARALELRGLQPQRVGVKLQGLHKITLHMGFYRRHHQRGHLSQQGFQFLQCARNDRPEHLS